MRRRFIVDLIDSDETDQFVGKYGADEITNMTNGDVIKALFPQIKTKELREAEVLWVHNTLSASCDLGWWNAPYKAGSEGMTCQKKILKNS